MKRYRDLNNVEIESPTGKYALADECFDVSANAEGLWLHTPKINGKRYSINLTNKNSSRMISELWQQIYNKSLELTGESHGKT